MISNKPCHNPIIVLFIIGILLIPSLLVEKPLTASQETNEKEYFALIAGCMVFQNSSWNIVPENQTTDKFHRYLYDSLLESANWKEENILLLTDEQATREAILQALTNFSEQVGENDVFLFSFHSHGNQIPDENGDEATFNETDIFDETIAPYDINVRNGSLINYISDDELTTYLNLFSCDTIIVNIEACFSGGFAQDLTNIPLEPASPNRFIMLSTPENNLEWIHPRLAWGWMASLGFSLSTPYTDRNGDGWISVEEAFQLASPLYTYRTYLYIDLLPFLASSMGTYVLYHILTVLTHSFATYRILGIILSFLVGFGVVKTIENSSERYTGYPSANIATHIDMYPGELPLIQLG